MSIETGKTGVKFSIKKECHNLKTKAVKSVKENFIFASLNFIFIVAFIQGFQYLFGAKNSIVAVILTILMGIYAGRDVAASPVKQFFTHTAVLSVMSTAACFSVALGTWAAIPINLAVTFAILYAYTYEYSGHLYFPYILSYLFLVYITPVTPVELPVRLLSVAVGTFCMLFYALILRSRNISRPAQNALSELLNYSGRCVRGLAAGAAENLTAEARCSVYKLSKNAEMRKKGALHYSGSAFTLLDAGRGLEHLVILLRNPVYENEKYAVLWPAVEAFIADCYAFVRRKQQSIPEVGGENFLTDDYSKRLERALISIREKLMAQKEKAKEKAPSMPLADRIKAAVGFSPVRLVYAARASLLLTAFMIPVQYLALAHGKWLLFTLASVSLPYADDVLIKAKKRFAATLIGGAAAIVLFSLFPDPTARTAIMMLSGYLSFYFKGYVGNYACATVGALGGAVFQGVIGWAGVSAVFGIRLAYIAAGIAIALAANLLICPFRRKRASEVIYRDYNKSSDDIVRYVTKGAVNRQLYYDEVIRNNLLEEMLLKNSDGTDGSDAVKQTVTYNRARIRSAHFRAAGHAGACDIREAG